MMQELFKYVMVGDVQDVIQDSLQLVVPFKVAVFYWRFFLGKLSTHEMLQRRGILVAAHDVCCPLCFSECETSSHIFFHCQKSSSVWQEVLRWMRLYFPNRLEHIDHFRAFEACSPNKHANIVNYLVWVVGMWCIWVYRNNVLFRRMDFNVSVVVIHIKRLSWGWFISKANRHSGFTISDWWSNLIRCLNNL